MRRGIAGELPFVAAGGDDDAVAVHHDGADRHVARRGRLLRLGERQAHPFAVDRPLHEHSLRENPHN